MLTNKKIIVLIVLLSFFTTSCGEVNIENGKINKVKNEKIKVVTGNAQKAKAIGGEVSEQGSIEKSIYDGKDNIAPSKPDFIK